METCLSFELTSTCGCNMRKRPTVQGDYVIDPEQLPASPPEEVEQQNISLYLPQEHLDEVGAYHFSSCLSTISPAV